MGKAVKGFQTAASEFNDELKKATAEDATPPAQVTDKPAATPEKKQE